LKMIKSDLHGDMQEELYGELFARGTFCVARNIMNGPKVAKFLVG
jgi:hypothetical protein